MDLNAAKNLRSSERWMLLESIAGTFGNAEVMLLNVAEQGVQVEHAQPLRIATRARLRFRRGEIAANVAGMLVWSHLSKTPNDAGKYLYHSGMRIEPDGDDFARVVAALAAQRLLRHDAESMEKKRQRTRERELAPKPVMTYLRPPEISADHVLLVQHARERLRAHPDEALKWYNRARFVTEDEAQVPAEIPYREEALAVWEYLERTVPVSDIVRVFEKR